MLDLMDYQHRIHHHWYDAVRDQGVRQYGSGHMTASVSRIGLSYGYKDPTYQDRCVQNIANRTRPTVAHCESSRPFARHIKQMRDEESDELPDRIEIYQWTY
uniref:Uncharacterized protein LOC114913925 n=1 Tax=Elaeis guineensis var. tenera TaxID=51953 RepID=A0A8N4ETW9_ELAGV|nr:uncharacterized protein LOC114913925 [Elaeis guineensis]